MKSILLSLTAVVCVFFSQAQITSPLIRANFGVDGELRANIFNSGIQASDDWFISGGTPGAGTFIIDTTGAAAMMARYATDINFRKLPFVRRMRFPAYSTVNNRLLIDAIFARDYHGSDSTMFAAGASKNGMSPGDWNSPDAQSIPDKNDILDMMVHVRRAGPNLTDSLWMFGGVSIENVTGSRYFDFEMYQTDITFSKVTHSFSGYGPDAGHTRWRFDAAGNITTPGDIIFTAEYGTSGLTLLEARIWIDQASLSLTPATFAWGGEFDGASNGSQFGYASILPKTAGAFYNGLTSTVNTWPGPFGLVLGSNAMPANYIAKQYMEFSVNMTKLGLDPVTLLGGSPCGMPFRRFLVKTRTSNSFTASLKDFIGPFEVFNQRKVNAQTDFSFYCGVYGVSTLEVTNPEPTSTYIWSTTNGHIVNQSGTTAWADAPGTYIVTQTLHSGCPAYAIDTIQITFDPICSILDDNIVNFKGNRIDDQTLLNWDLVKQEGVKGFVIERSSDGKHFATVGEPVLPDLAAGKTYEYADVVGNTSGKYIYYRLRVMAVNGQVEYSGIIRVSLDDVKTGLAISPNPVKDAMYFSFDSEKSGKMQWRIFDASGKLVAKNAFSAAKGRNVIRIKESATLKNGYYLLRVDAGEKSFTEKFIVLP